MAKVLAVEDDPDILRLVTLRLQSAGHRVVTSSSAREALRTIEERGLPDVVVLDVGLPDVDGVELLQQLRALEGGDALPAVFLSARVREQDVERGRALGATYLTKPFVATALLNAVQRALPESANGW